MSSTPSPKYPQPKSSFIGMDNDSVDDNIVQEFSCTKKYLLRIRDLLPTHDHMQHCVHRRKGMGQVVHEITYERKREREEGVLSYTPEFLRMAGGRGGLT